MSMLRHCRLTGNGEHYAIDALAHATSAFGWVHTGVLPSNVAWRVRRTHRP